MKAGLWPEPPPVTMPTLPGTGAIAARSTRGSSVAATTSGCARTKPRSMSSTTSAGSSMIRCMGPLPAVAPNGEQACIHAFGQPSALEKERQLHRLLAHQG